MNPTRRDRGALAGIPSLLWRAVALADRRLLATDYDGTLAPFQIERRDALPDPRALAALERLARGTGTRVAVVSGRPLGDLVRFLGSLPAHLVGEHGWDERTTDGDFVCHPLPPVVAEALGSARVRALESAEAARIEEKRASLVLHTRGMAADDSSALEAAVSRHWLPLTSHGALRLDQIDGGLELRAIQRDKGKAVAALIAAEAQGTLTVFVGDDVTDEDGFEAAAASGFGVRVGREDRPTNAAGQLPDIPAVADFFEEWARLTGIRVV